MSAIGHAVPPIIAFKMLGGGDHATAVKAGLGVLPGAAPVPLMPTAEEREGEGGEEGDERCDASTAEEGEGEGGEEGDERRPQAEEAEGEGEGEGKEDGEEQAELALDHAALGVDKAALAYVLRKLEDERHHPRLSLDDIHGQPDAKARARAQVAAIRQPERFVGAARPSAGLLLTGPSGTGKTSLVRAMAHDAACTFFDFRKSDLVVKGKPSLERLNALIAVAKEYEPSIVFLDEIDGVASARNTGMVAELKVLLETRDAARIDAPVVILVGATNHQNHIDGGIVD